MKKAGTGDPVELRRLAEERVPRGRDGSADGQAPMAPETERLVHELRVHHIELEMQNEELQRTRTDLEELLSHYTHLYESAPIGYLTLGRDGGIRQVNLTGARLLGLERVRLVGRPLGFLLAAESRPTFNAFLAKVFASRTTQTCELLSDPEGATPLALEFTGTARDEKEACRVVAKNITERKLAEERIKGQLEELQRWQDVMLGREDRVQELKREVNELCRRTGEPARYPSQEADPAVVATRKPGS